MKPETKTKNLRADLEKAQAALAAKTQAGAPFTSKSVAYTVDNPLAFVRRFERAAEMFGIEDRNITWGSSGVAITTKGMTARIGELLPRVGQREESPPDR